MAQEVQLAECPVCGTTGAPGDFCEMCGRRLGQPPPAVHGTAPVTLRPEPWSIPEAVSRPIPTPPSMQPPTLLPGAGDTTIFPVRPLATLGTGGDLVLERDELCVFFEGMAGMLRFRITALRRLEAVTLEMENSITGEKRRSRRVAAMETGTKREIGVSISGQAAGLEGWFLKVSCEVDGRKHSLEGEVPVLSLRPREAQKAAENLSLTINNNITNGHASDVILSQHAADDLARLAQAENPFEALRKIVQGSQRAWVLTSLDRGGGLEGLPPMPAEAVADRLTLELGTGRLHVLVGRTVTVGREKGLCEIALRPVRGADRSVVEGYMRLSRRHCHFEARGERVAVVDGARDGMKGVRPSTWGTYWNGNPIDGTLMLDPGQSGILSLASAVRDGEGRSFRAKACRPGGPCAECTRTDKTWCGEGKHACLLLTRLGRLPEAYLALWGCFQLGEVDPAFEGVTLFREHKGFAWRRGRRCGWLVPGTELETEFGLLRVHGPETPPGLPNAGRARRGMDGERQADFKQA